ncbi:MAG TPA: type II CRISPR-associated endonuclease Cas1 [Flavobacteriales bacterium]|nr:type II CRISPR-associated endonuclease Cas1 [Flavobacteriales bacterium]
MIKRTIAITTPCHLSLKLGQMLVRSKLVEGDSGKSVPIEDMGMLLMEHEQVTVTQGLLAALLEHNVAVVNCNEQHHPVGMLLNFEGNSTQTESFIAQAEASKPLKKQLWQQVVKAKITNQAAILEKMGQDGGRLQKLAQEVRSGDTDNREGVAAVHYWPRLFTAIPHFLRAPDGHYPNNLLNYGYAILRATMARALAGSGLHPTLGLFHRNRYNAYCLADDMMEPYRPLVDQVVAGIVLGRPLDRPELDQTTKIDLLRIPTLDVDMDGKTRPLMVAVSETTASLARAYLGADNQLALPRPA